MPPLRSASDTLRIQPAVIPAGAGAESRVVRRRSVDVALPAANIDGVRRDHLPDVGRARRGERAVELGSTGTKLREVGLSQKTGRFTIGGAGGEKPAREALAIYGAAELIAAGTDVV